MFRLYGWGWLVGWAGQPPHMNTIHINQSAVLLYHINNPVMIRTSQPNRLVVFALFYVQFYILKVRNMRTSTLNLDCRIIYAFC